MKRKIHPRKLAEESLRASEEEAQRIAREALAMAEISRIISSTLTVEEVYEPFAAVVKRIIPFDRIVINMIDSPKGTFKNVYMAGVEIEDRQTGKVHALEGSGMGEMLRTMSPFLLQSEDFTDYHDRFPMLLSTFEAGFRSILDVPLFSRGKIIGGLLLRSLELRAYTNEHVRLAERIGDQIAGAIANAQLFLKQKQAEKALDERLRFERLLSEISARFVNILPDQVDPEINRALSQILEFFRVERCGLLQTLPGKTSWKITHVAAAEDVPSVPLGTELPVSIYPWAYDKMVRKREVVSFSGLDDLPSEANVDKQTWIEWGIRSNLSIPILIGEPVDHIFVINSVRNEQVWHEELFPRLQLLGEIFVNALERKQIRLEIEERLRFETLISELSAGFVNLPSYEVDARINEGLRVISEFFDADRCSIGLFSEGGARLGLAFEYRLAGAQPAAESISKEQMPWYLDQLLQGKAVVMNRVEDLPPEAEKEGGMCLARGMKSVLSVPMLSGAIVMGSCALVSTRAERVWGEEMVKRFRLMSEVFSNALQRKQAEEASRESERVLRQNENELRSLAGRLIDAQEEERGRLARELHDDLAQRLAVFAIDVGKLHQQLINPPTSVLEKLREIKEDVVKISQDVHSLSRQLHPSILDDLGLIKAAEAECKSFSRREGVDVVFNHENISRLIPKDISLSLYRIIQEGLRNISKHACAEHISVSLKGIDGSILLSVQDDGIGFDWEEVKKQPGLGFSSMRERARLIHGELSIQSQPEKGTVITVRVPLTGEGP